jgi:hypothetical protein
VVHEDHIAVRDADVIDVRAVPGMEGREAKRKGKPISLMPFDFEERRR